MNLFILNFEITAKIGRYYLIPKLQFNLNFRLTANIRTNFIQMIQNRFFLILATISSISLGSISVFLIPQAVKTHRYNKCIDTQLAMRFAINPGGEAIPGKLNYLKAVEHCEGF